MDVFIGGLSRCETRLDVPKASEENFTVSGSGSVMGKDSTTAPSTTDNDTYNTGVSVLKSNSLNSYLSAISSTSSKQCRICYQSASENQAAGQLIPCGCLCTGTTGNAHRQCLQEWVNTQHSNICEICGHSMVNFHHSTSPNNQIHNNNYCGLNSCQPQGFGMEIHNVDSSNRGNVVFNLTDNATERQSSSNSIRAGIIAVFVILLIATIASGTIAVNSHKDIQQLMHKTVNAESRGAHLQKLNSLTTNYGLNLAIFVFCSTLTLAVGAVWFCTELYILSQAQTQPTRDTQSTEVTAVAFRQLPRSRATSVL